MKHKSLILNCLMILWLVLGMNLAASAQEYSFSVEATSDGTIPKEEFDPGDVFYLNVLLDNVQDVAGCAFTLEYPSNVLSPPVTDAQGLSAGITSLFPFTYNSEQTHRGNSAEQGKIYLAGVAIAPGDGGALYASGEAVLFRIEFTVKEDAPFGNFTVSLKPTVLTNFDAGYNNEQVAVLVGAVDHTHENWADLSLACPNLFPTPPAILAQATLNIREFSVNLTPSSVADVVAGEAVALTAQVLINGSPMDLTDPAALNFTTSGTGTFGEKSILNGDVVVNYTTALLVETATITATETITGGNHQDTSTIASVAGPLATLAIQPPEGLALSAGEILLFTVSGTDANTNPVPIGTITWSVEGDIGTIDPSSGLFEARTVGTGLVRATSNLGGMTGTSGTITVSAGALAALEISPADAIALTSDDTQQFSASGEDAYDNPVTAIGSITWSVNGGIGTISDTGLFEATTVGSGSVTATSNSISTNSGTITVSAGALATLEIHPAGAIVLTADDTQLFEISGTDAKGNEADLGEITWSVNGGVGTIDTAGLFSATTVGTGSVTATSSHGRAVMSEVITVTPGVAASILLASDRDKVASQGEGAPAHLTATVRDADGNTKTDLPVTSMTFAVSGATQYAAWTSRADDTESGIAGVWFNSEGEKVGEPAVVNIVASGGGLTSNSIALEIVDLSAAADFYALVTTGAPKQARIEAVGAENYTWSVISGHNGLSASTGDVVIFTAPDSITGGIAGDPTVIRVADADAPAETFDLTITTFEPVTFLAPAAPIGITHDGAVAAYQLEAAGGDGNYSYQVNGETGVITVDGNGLVAGVAPGIRTVYVWDANGDAGTENSFRAETVPIEVVDGIVVTPAISSLLAGETLQFGAAGAKGDGVAANYSWSVNDAGAGSIDANGLFTAAALSTAQTVIVTAADKTYANIAGTAMIHVYATLAIDLPEGYDPEDPATWPVVPAGWQYELSVAGGEGTSYTWSVEGPVGVAGGVGDLFAFEAPTEGPFAGVYEVTVTDDMTGGSFTIKVKVPMTLSPSELRMRGLGDPGWYYAFLVAGAPEGTGFEVRLVTTTGGDIADQEEYGTIESDGIFDEEAMAEFYFSPATLISGEKTFLFRISTIEEGDEMHLQAAGLNILYSGLMRIFPAGAEPEQKTVLPGVLLLLLE